MMKTRAVIYARYSADRQRETSIDDQVRNCNRHAEHEGLRVLSVFEDKAISGSTRARPGYLRMREAAADRAFDVLLVDDLSRLSRDDYEMKGLLRTFTWDGLRVIGVTDGYDSNRKGHKIHAGFKGLMNEMFLDDQRERTHRGMTGQALKGYNCGGRTFGYRNVPIEDETRKNLYGRPSVLAVRYEIDEDQAAVVRDIYAWYAEGRSYRWIATELNRYRVRSSRGKAWVVSAIKVILDNEMYAGRVIWNRTKWTKHPETGKRIPRPRPREEWIIHESPELRIVNADVVAAVRTRQHERRKPHHCIRRGHSRNPFTPSSAQRYLFSGLLSCAECGANFVIVAHGRYGCPTHAKGVIDGCSNTLSVPRSIVEERLLHSIKSQLLAPGSFEKFKKAAVEVIESRNATSRLQQVRDELKEAERELGNLLDAIKQGVVTPTTTSAMRETEARISELNEEIEQLGTWRVSGILPRALERYQEAVQQLEARLGDHVEPAREILKSIIGERVRIHRQEDHLIAEIPNPVGALLAKSLNQHVDLSGSGGAQWNESTWVSLQPTHADHTPPRHTERRSRTRRAKTVS
jgi:DNA invertase Pin-like site-specific DNA recombinase